MGTTPRISAIACLMALAGCSGGALAGAPATGITQESRTAPLDLQAGHRADSTLFIADVDSNVLLYPADIHDNPSLQGEITKGVTRSLGVCTDRRGTLYVANSGGSQPSIAEYKRGATSPFRTITSGLRAPEFDVVDSEGNLYVADSGSVLVYAQGASSPSRTISIPGGNFVGGLAFDPAGDLLVNSLNVKGGVATVYAVKAGSSTPQNLGLQDLPNGLSLGADKTGNIYAGGHAGEIAIYAPGSKSPTRSFDVNVDGFYTQMLVTPDGTIYWPNYDNGEMFEFAPGASTPTNVFATAGSGIDAAIGPSGQNLRP